jgi:hypothetical protein
MPDLSPRARELLLSYFLSTAYSPSLTQQEIDLAKEVMDWFTQFEWTPAKQLMIEGLMAHLEECEIESRGETP